MMPVINKTNPEPELGLPQAQKTLLNMLHSSVVFAVFIQEKFIHILSFIFPVNLEI